MNGKIFPRNLTAHLATRVAGNPAVSRLESSVANCFPGLEMDVRNLDRRFFPGLLFDYVGGPDSGLPQNNQQGVKLLYINCTPEQEPMLPESGTEDWQQELLDALNGDVGDSLGEGNWYLHSIEQGGNRVELYQYAYFENSTQRVPYEAETVWWLIRGITSDDKVTIELVQRDATGAIISPPVRLTGYRRRYLDQNGSLAEVFRPGELTESLCSPWTHDFRDCACHYWAASHPDVVLGVVDEGDALPGGGSDDPIAATTYLDWLRADRGKSGLTEYAPTITTQRKSRIDQYAINSLWEELAFVIDGREIADVVRFDGGGATAEPYDSLEELIHELETRLAPMELTLLIQYLYALFSVKSKNEAPADCWPTLRDDIGQIRQFITLVAVGEMQHLRWANQLLWLLYDLVGEGVGKYQPVIRLTDELPGSECPALERLTPETLKRFIAYERPGGEIFHSYARCVATLEDKRFQVPPHMFELAAKIDADGLEHYTRFSDLLTVLDSYAGADGHPYLRELKVANSSQTGPAMDLFDAMIANLRNAYSLEAAKSYTEAQLAVAAARDCMHSLNLEAEKLAAAGIGMPFFSSNAISA